MPSPDLAKSAWAKPRNERNHRRQTRRRFGGIALVIAFVAVFVVVKLACL